MTAVGDELPALELRVTRADGTVLGTPAAAPGTDASGEKK